MGSTGKKGPFKRFGLAAAAVVCAAALAGIGSTLSAQGTPGQQRPDGVTGGPGGRGGRPGGPMMGGPGGILGPAFGRLDLTDAQKERVKGIVESHRDEFRALGDKAAAAQQALDVAVNGETFDEAGVRAKAAERAAVETDIAVARARVFAEAYQILTPDQQKTLKDLQAQMQQRMDHRQERRPR